MTSTGFEDAKTAKVNGTTLAYREEGEGEPVVSWVAIPPPGVGADIGQLDVRVGFVEEADLCVRHETA